MSNKKQKDNDNEMSENSVNEILFSEETQEKESKDSKKKSKRLITSSTQESGPGSLGEAPMIKPTPPDATGLVRLESGKLKIDTKAIAIENKTLKASVEVLQDEIVALRSQLVERSKSPRSQPDPSPSKDLSTSEGLEGALSHIQFDKLLNFVGDQVRIYQESQSAAKSGKKTISKAPSLDLEAPGPSRIVSSHTGSAEKSVAKPSHKDIVGSSLGDGSGDDMDITLDDRADDDFIG